MNVVDSDIVVGEGVALDVPGASPALRITSGIIDAVFSILVVGGATYWLSRHVEFSMDNIYTVVIVVVATMMVGIPVLMETVTRGQSLGRAIMGLRVVRVDHGPAGFRHALVRAVIGIVELWGTSGILAFVVAALSKKHQRLGDFAAGTVVIKDRMKLDITGVPPIPHELEQWVGRADVAQMPPTLSMSIRQYLLRREKMAAHARYRHAVQLAESAKQWVYPAWPDGADPERVLMAITAERARRDLDLISRQRAVARRILG